MDCLEVADISTPAALGHDLVNTLAAPATLAIDLLALLKKSAASMRATASTSTAGSDIEMEILNLFPQKSPRLPPHSELPGTFNHSKDSAAMANTNHRQANLDEELTMTDFDDGVLIDTGKLVMTETNDGVLVDLQHLDSDKPDALARFLLGRKPRDVSDAEWSTFCKNHMAVLNSVEFHGELMQAYEQENNEPWINIEEVESPLPAIETLKFRAEALLQDFKENPVPDVRDLVEAKARHHETVRDVRQEVIHNAETQVGQTAALFGEA